MTKYIKFTESTFGNDNGDKVKIVHEDDKCYYYYDNFRRYCFIFKEADLDCYELVTSKDLKKGE